MGDLEPGARSSAADRRDRLVERREQLVRLVAHVGRIQPAAPGRRCDQSLDLPGRSVHPRGIDEPRGQADRAGIKGVLDCADHCCQLLVGRRPRVGADDRSADRALADEERNIQAERLLGDTIEILPECPPPGDQAIRTQQQLHGLAPDVGDRSQRVATVSRQLRRVALVEKAGQRPVEEQRAVRVAVRIDEARCDDAAGDIEQGLDLTLSDRREVADSQDPVAEDTDIGRAAGAPSPVDQGPAPKQQVECRHAAMVTRSAQRLARNVIPAHLPSERGRTIASRRMGG